MAKSQHPAAKAGRLVRAVGIGVARELEKRADAPPKAPPPPPPPPAPTRTLVARAGFALFVASAVALVAVLIKLEKVFPHDARTGLRVVLTVVLALGALVQLTNWRKVNDSIVQRLLTKLWGSRGAANRRERTFARIGREALIVIGIAWLAASVFELLIAIGVSDATVVG